MSSYLKKKKKTFSKVACVYIYTNTFALDESFFVLGISRFTKYKKDIHTVLLNIFFFKKRNKLK